MLYQQGYALSYFDSLPRDLRDRINYDDVAHATFLSAIINNVPSHLFRELLAEIEQRLAQGEQML